MKHIIFRLSTLALSSTFLVSMPQAMQAPKSTIPTAQEIRDEQNVIENMTVVKTNPAFNQRFPISNAHVITPTLNLIKKMRGNLNYIPSIDERKILYICYNVLLNALTNPDSLKKSDKHAGLMLLKENENISYNAATQSLKLNSKIYANSPDNWIELSMADVDWAVNHIEQIVDAAHGKAQATPDIILSPQPQPQPQPVGAIDEKQQAEINKIIEDWRQWNYELANMVNVYFKERYRDQAGYSISKTINGTQYIVPRPNHALAHGMRSAFIAVDFAEKFLLVDPSVFKDKNTQGLATLVRKYDKEDPNFLKKISMAAAFQRTGRQSEVSGKESPQAAIQYTSYVKADAALFTKAAKEMMGPGKLFKDEQEISAYAYAIYNPYVGADGKEIDVPSLTKDENQLRVVVHSLIWIGHMLDLKRLANERPDHPARNYGQNQIKTSSAINMGFPYLVGGQDIINPKTGKSDWKNYFFQNQDEYPIEMDIVNMMWDREEGYLEATGDHPLSSWVSVNTQFGPSKEAIYEDKFFIQAKDPKLMVDELLKAKMRMDKSDLGEK